MKITPLLLWALALFSSSTFANQKPNGWRWYNEPKVAPKENVIPQKQSSTPSVTVTRTMTAKQQLDWFKGVHEEVQAAAIIDPTNEQKAALLMHMNKYVSDKSSTFGMTFKKVLHTTPELDYLKDRPAEAAARQEHLKGIRNKHINSIHKMSNDGWGMFYVYNGSDALSDTLGSSLQEFSDKHGIALLGVSKDNNFALSVRSNEADNKGRIDVPFVPAIILANPKTKEMKPLSYGFISMDKLYGRFHNVATNYQDQDF